MSVTPARRAAAGTFQCSSCRMRSAGYRDWNATRKYWRGSAIYCRIRFTPFQSRRSRLKNFPKQTQLPQGLSFMHKIPRLFAALVASAALLSVPVALAQDAKSKAAPARADAAAKGKELYSQGSLDFMLKQRTAQGQPDTPELRTAVRDELNTRELLVREAKRQGLDKSPALKTELDLTTQTVLVRAYMADYLKAHPVPDDVLRKEYDNIKGQIGDKEYKVRHILVDKEDEAKEIIASLQKGEKFEK